MSRFKADQENTALLRSVATRSPACELGWSARAPHLTTIDAQRAAVQFGK